MKALCAWCAAARQSPLHRWFSPACLHCGARLIQSLGELGLPAHAVRNRRQAALKTWVEHGHPEEALRSLAKGEKAYGPAKA